MLKSLKVRLFQGFRTNSFPDTPPNLPAHFRGRPAFHPGVPASASAVCPTGAFLDGEKPEIDLGKCIFCGRCAESCPDAVQFTREYRLGAFSREKLLVRSGENAFVPDEQLSSGFRALYGKSLKIRQVSAGGCAACELDFNVLGTLAWDMGRFGIHVVASPRHADCLLVTGPVTDNMLIALKKTYEAMPKPNFVIACGTCALSGGIYKQSTCCSGGVQSVLPVSLFVPGCPPHPATLLEALVRCIGRRTGAPVENE